MASGVHRNGSILVRFTFNKQKLRMGTALNWGKDSRKDTQVVGDAGFGWLQKAAAATDKGGKNSTNKHITSNDDEPLHLHPFLQSLSARRSPTLMRAKSVRQNMMVATCRISCRAVRASLADG